MTTPAEDLRSQQSRLTRDLIMDAVADVILERGVQDLSVQQVADEAGVSHRTVYRHYPSKQALLEALAEWLSEQFAARLGPEQQMFEDIAAGAVASFSAMDVYARHARAYVVVSTALGLSPKVRVRRTQRMRKAVEDGPARHLPRDQARAVSALVRGLISSSNWYQLTTQLGLDGPTAGHVVGWALEVLFEELENGGGPGLPD